MRAVVLSGGGTKGSYEIGAWRALREIDYSYEIVTGTSIGALNGALMVMNEYEKALDLWNNIEIDDVIQGEVNDEYERDKLLSDKKNLFYYLKSYFINGSLDITPLKRLVYQTIDTRKIKSSSCKYGIVVVSLPFLNQIEISSSDMKEDEIVDYILASASCFPAFPIYKISNRLYIDGGYADNLPIDLAFKYGADEIVAIDLHDKKPVHPKYLNHPHVHYIQPHWDLGSFLSFDSNTIKKNMLLGYYDTLKHFNKLEGIKYTFEKEEDNDLLEISKRYQEEIFEFEKKYTSTNSSFITDAILEESTLPPSIYTFFIKGLENCMEILDFSPYKLYKISAIILDLKSKDYLHSSLEEQINFSKIQSISSIYKELKEKGEYYILRFLQHFVNRPNTSYSFMLPFLSKFPKEFSAIIFLNTIKKESSL